MRDTRESKSGEEEEVTVHEKEEVKTSDERYLEEQGRQLIPAFLFCRGLVLGDFAEVSVSM
jgi:hypothetical protein